MQKNYTPVPGSILTEDSWPGPIAMRLLVESWHYQSGATGQMEPAATVWPNSTLYLEATHHSSDIPHVCAILYTFSLCNMRIDVTKYYQGKLQFEIHKFATNFCAISVTDALNCFYTSYVRHEISGYPFTNGTPSKKCSLSL